MKITCLYPFYEYILKNWVCLNKELPVFEQQFPDVVNKHMGKNNAILVQRKQYIWNSTRDILLLDEDKRLSELQKCQAQSVNCGLCIQCRNCEREYWEELEKILKVDKQAEISEKSIFLIPDKIKNLLFQKQKPVDIYLEHCRREIREHTDILVMLKGFSSSTPILLNYAESTNFYSGGGFYFRWKNVGVAVDPGYLFVQNLHNYGLSVLDIDVVIITHEHIDHNSDMRILDDLHCQVSGKAREMHMVWDSVEHSIKEKKAENHKILWYMDEASCEAAVAMLQRKSGFDGEYNQIYCVAVDKQRQDDLKEKFKGCAEVITENDIYVDHFVLHVFPTAHEQYNEDGIDKYFCHTYGVAFECLGENSVSIGYTSDTSIQDDKSYIEMLDSLRGCQIIIANISGIYEKDVLLHESKPRHLGYYGCYKLLYDLLKQDKAQLQYFLLSEFSNQVSDIRFEVSKYLQEEIRQLAEQLGIGVPRILPTETELTLDLKKMKIRCTFCQEFAGDIRVMRPYGENDRLQYICSKCIY